jgi:hypothetical protein
MSLGYTDSLKKIKDYNALNDKELVEQLHNKRKKSGCSNKPQFS